MKIGNSPIVFLLLLFLSCITRVDFETDDSTNDYIVVDGLITNIQGPYTVRIFRPSGTQDNLLSGIPVVADKVTIFDDASNSESLIPVEAGVYQTDPNGIRGVVGRKYWIRIELRDGSIFESQPDEINPSGEIDSLYTEFVSTKPLNGVTQYGYKVFIDSSSDTEYVRWKFTGTYKAFTFPEKHTVNSGCVGPRYPPPCSGYTSVDGYGFVRTTDCTCCICWLTDAESKPHLGDNLIQRNGAYKQVELAYIPFDVLRFYFKRYMIKVEQMTLSEQAFNFWNLIKDQKEGISSLFQPSYGSIPTNIFSTNTNKRAVGIFYAASIDSKVTFITGANPEVPYPDFETPPEEFCFLFDACDIVYDYLDASRTPPSEWVE